MSQTPSKLKGAFDGVKILDFTQVIAGAYSTAILADMGAEVLKIEPPGIGDNMRLVGPLRNGVGCFFQQTCRSKKSVSVDLKNPEGVALVKRLVPHVDVVAENAKPGVMDKLGLGYEAIRAIKGDIIYTSISGYGHGNRYSKRSAYDNIIQSDSGLAMLAGFPEDDVPMRSPLSVADYAAAVYGSVGTMAALYHHRKTGEGQHVDVAMYDALLSYMDNTFMIYDMLKGQASLEDLGLTHTGNRHLAASPHGFYRTQDGHVAHMSLTNAMWHKLLGIIDREDLVGDERYDTLEARKLRWREVDDLVEQWTAQRTTQEVLDALSAHRLPCGPARTVEDVYLDPQSTERDIFHDLEHPDGGRFRVHNIPIKSTVTPPAVRAPAPRLGEHNAEVLGQYLEMSADEVEALTEAGVLYRQP
jgi:CoA:oxalate CoA-transferase